MVCKPARRTTTSAQGAKKLRGSKYVDLHSAHRWGQIAHRWGQNPLKNNNFGFPAPKTTVEPPLQSYRSPLFECEFNFGAAATAIEIELVEGVCITKSLSFSEIAPDRRPYIYMGLRSPCSLVSKKVPKCSQRDANFQVHYFNGIGLVSIIREIVLNPKGAFQRTFNRPHTQWVVATAVSCKMCNRQGNLA